MASTVTLEQVEALAAQLPPAERLRLAARLCEELSTTLPAVIAEQNALSEQVRQERVRLADQLLAECEGVEDGAQGIDTAEVIRRMRDERIEQLCQSDASTPASP